MCMKKWRRIYRLCHHPPTVQAVPRNKEANPFPRSLHFPRTGDKWNGENGKGVSTYDLPSSGKRWEPNQTDERTMIGDAAICEGRISKDCRSHVREPPRDIFIHFEPTTDLGVRPSVRLRLLLFPHSIFFGMANGGQGKKEREMETDPADRKEGVTLSNTVCVSNVAVRVQLRIPAR